MSLIEEAKAYKTARKGPRCTATLFLERLTETNRADVLEALADPEVQLAALRELMVDRGWNPPKAPVLARHRRRECLCHD